MGTAEQRQRGGVTLAWTRKGIVPVGEAHRAASRSASARADVLRWSSLSFSLPGTEGRRAGLAPPWYLRTRVGSGKA